MARSRHDILQFFLDSRIKFSTVSGILANRPNLIQWVDQNIREFEVITTKSFQLKPNPGNREPIVVEVEVGSYGNAVGLKNPGMEVAWRELRELRYSSQLRCILNVSLSADCVEDFVTLVKKFEDVADMFELNFSCPHAKAGYGSSIGEKAEFVAEYTAAIRAATDLAIFSKLTPNVNDIGAIAKAAVEAGADGISAINTVGPETYLDPHTAKPVLSNPAGNKGGKSGEWILESAIKNISQIRQALGPQVPILGMGGITKGRDVKRMAAAGANVIGVGSVLARVGARSTSAYLSALKSDALSGENNAQAFVSNKRLAEYLPFRITKVVSKSPSLKLLELDGRLDYNASEYVFLWLPGVGEKPFSIATSNPLSFVVGAKKYVPEESKGLVTHALLQLKQGDELMVRGIYGADAPESTKKTAYIVVGGTGVAVAPRLAEKLSSQGKRVTIYYGVRSIEHILLEEEMSRYAKVITVADDGRVGRVLEVMKEDLAKSSLTDCCFFNIGPAALMTSAMDLQSKLGGSSSEIYSSLETNNACGIGLCGMCECGGTLTCQEGTFFSLSYLQKHRIDIAVLCD